MINHNLKLILRNLWKKRVYTSVIILSLTVGFVCSNILISFLVYETNTDKFHDKQDRIFQMISSDPMGGNSRVAFIPEKLKNYLTTNYAEVENICQLHFIDKVSIEAQGNTLHDFNVLSVDSSFFSIFDFPLSYGDRSSSLSLGNIVLSKEKAMVLFGQTDVIGYEVALQNPDTTQLLTVAAVVDKSNENSHLTFDALVYHSAFQSKWWGGASYVLLNSNNISESLQQKINLDDQRPSLLGPGKLDYFLDPLSNSYFNTDNKMSYMKTRSPMFMKVGYIVCGLILFISSFNFINLFLLFWQDRSKEIGIKKTLGITPKSLFGFSVAEAGVYIFIGYLLSLVITLLTIPVFNSVFEANLSPEYFLNLKVITLIGAVLFVSGALIVLLSVMRQWKMKPISLMSKGASKVVFSKSLFTIQFVISITLAICSITIIQQMHYLENAPLGFNRHLIQLNAPDKKFSSILQVLKQKFTQFPDVNNVTVSGGNPISGNMIARYDLGLDNEKFYSPYLFGGDEDFIKTLDLKLIEGEIPSERNDGKLVNQTLVRQFNIKDPIGKFVPGTEDIIKGVVEDFTCSSFKQEIPPVIISYNKDGRALLIDYKGGDLSKLLLQMQSEWETTFPNYPFTYHLIEEDIAKKYKEESFFFRIIIAFAIISMILSCFGLFALSWAVIQSRTKEMGIRKILGATSLDIVNILTLTFTKRIMFAFIIAVPIGYYLMNQWLMRFANKIELNVWIFSEAIILVTLVALVTLSFQTVKATMTNPAEEIRNE